MIENHVDLEDLIGNTFVKVRHGIKTVVTLESVRKRKVVLRSPDRADSFSETIADFTRYYNQSS